MVGCEQPRKPSSPLAKQQATTPGNIAERTLPDTALMDMQNLLSADVLTAETEAHQDIAPELHPDIFDAGDRTIVLGSDTWVTLEDGRQIKVVYSTDGKLLFINDHNVFEMWSKTSIGFSLHSQIEVYEVAIKGGKLVISGSARRVKGDTVMSQKETQDFVLQLSEGQEPGFPVSTALSTGLIRKHEKQEEPE